MLFMEAMRLKSIFWKTILLILIISAMYREVLMTDFFNSDKVESNWIEQFKNDHQLTIEQLSRL